MGRRCTEKFTASNSAKDEFDVVADPILDVLYKLMQSGIDRRFSASVLVALAASEARQAMGAEDVARLLRHHADTIDEVARSDAMPDFNLGR